MFTIKELISVHEYIILKSGIYISDEGRNKAIKRMREIEMEMLEEK